MFHFLVALHVAAAIIFLGPVMLSTSTFQTKAKAAANGDAQAAGGAQLMLRTTNLYGYLSLLVPLFGVTLLFSRWDHFKTMPQFHAALALSIIAWIILLVLIIPKQRKVAGSLGLLETDETDQADVVDNMPKALKQLSMLGGIFNGLWFITLILMFVR